MLCDLCQLVRGQGEEGGDEDRFGDATFPVLGGLERFAWGLREAVEVEAVVPVGPADQREAVRPEPVERVLQRSLQMLVQRRLRTGVVVEGNLFVEDAAFARLLQVGSDGEDQPQRVVVESGSDGVVAALGQRLVLVIGAAGRELGGGDVEDPLARPVRNHVHETEQVLVGVTKAHPPAEAGLEEGGRAGQVEGGHALIGVPDVDHAIGVLARGGDLHRSELVRPVLTQSAEGGLDFGGSQQPSDHCIGT